MRDSPDLLTRIENAFCAAFDYDEVIAMLRTQFYTEYAQIMPVSDKEVTRVVQDVVRRQAEQPHGLKRLLEAAAATKPGDAQLRSLRDEVTDSVAGSIPPSAERLISTSTQTGDAQNLAQATTGGTATVNVYYYYYTTTPAIDADTPPSTSITSTAQTDMEDEFSTCPYPGMKQFSEAQTAFFFGRNREIEAVLQRLRDYRFLAVIGPSGSGKSSLVYAGCIPKLPQSRLFNRTAWNILSMRPGVTPHITLSQLLQSDQYLESVQSDSNTLIVIDQFEEAFTQPDPASTLEFQAMLVDLVEQEDAYLIMTVRADFYQGLMVSPLWPHLEANLFSVLPLRGDALREAIVRPATDAGVELSNDLVVQLLNDAADEPGALPFVQETLVLLWDKIDDGKLRLQAYQNLVNSYELESGSLTGGIQVAMAQRAERVYQALSPDQRDIARLLFLALVQFVQGRPETRRQQSVGQLRIDTFDDDVFETTLAKLTENRLLTMSGKLESNERHVDIAHESLIQGWPRLQTWISDYRRDEQVRRRIIQAAREWNGSPDSIAHTDDAGEMMRWAVDNLYTLNRSEHRFLTAVAIVEGPERLCKWLNLLPDNIRKAQVKDITDYIFTQRELVAETVRHTLISAAKLKCFRSVSNAEPAIDQEFVSTFWTTFEQGEHAKPTAGSVLWALRSALTPAKLLRVLPYAAIFWLRQHLGAIIAALLVLFATSAVWLGVRWTIQQRLGAWYAEPSVHAGFISAAALLPASPEQIFFVSARGVGRDDGAALFSHNAESDSWEMVANNLTPRGIPALITLPSGDGVRFYISVSGRGVLRSENGQQWQVVNQGLRSYVITSLISDPDNSNVVYAGSGDSRGIFATQDGGDSWSDITPYDLIGTSVTAMIFTRANGGLLLVGTEHGQVFSYARDDLWTPRAIYPGSGNVTAFAGEPINGMTVYAGTASGKLMRSFDGGLTWEFPKAFPKVFRVQSLAVVPEQPDHVFMSGFGIGGFVVWESTDAGATWEPVAANAFTRETVALLIPQDAPDTIFAYGLAGIFVSSDMGDSWRHVDLGAPLATVNHIIVDSQDSDSLYLTYGGSLFKRDSQTNEHWLRSDSLPLLTVIDVMPHPTVPDLVFATGYIPGEWSIFMSRNNGHTWSSTGQVPGHDAAYFNHTGSLAISLADGHEVIYAGTNGCGVIWSEDRGESWHTESRGQCILPEGSPRNIRDIDVVPGSPDKLYVIADQNRVYSSRDRGRTWEHIELPLTDELFELEIDRYDPQNLYAIAGADGFWRSTDSGQTWENRSGPLAEDYIVRIEAVSGGIGTLYAITRSGTLWKTSNGGESWLEMAGNPAMGSPVSLAYDSQSDSLLVGTLTSGLYRFQQWPFWQRRR